MIKELWLIWKEPKTRRRYKVGVLSYDGDKYQFKYINPELDIALLAGFTYFPGFNDLHIRYESPTLFANILTRLPNPARDDYLEILNMYGLERDAKQIDILESTRGRLLTDNYEFVSAFDSKKIEFDVAGTRHCSDVKMCLNIISVNDKLDLVIDKNNQYDKYAIKVILDKDGKKYHIGYVPRYYSRELTLLLEKNISYSAMIDSLNFENKFSEEAVDVLVKLIFSN